MITFWYLLVAHALCDYPLQGDFLAAAKNRHRPIKGIPWFHAMLAHAMIHGGAVSLVTGSVWLGLAEVVVHVLIDCMKCDEAIGYNSDQFLHVMCKVAWAAALVMHP